MRVIRSEEPRVSGTVAEAAPSRSAGERTMEAKGPILDPFATGGRLLDVPQLANPGAAAGQSQVALRAAESPIALRGYGARFQRLLDDTTLTVQRQGNRAELLPDGVNSFAERRRLIEQATHSILLQTFIFNDDETGWDTAALLAEKAKAGVKVCVIYDGMGSNRAGREIFTFMKNAGVEVREYGDVLTAPHLINNRWHEKLLVVDGHTAITGGMNIADEYAYGGSARMVLGRGKNATEPWRDMDIIVSGPVVRDMALRFCLNWQRLGEPFTDQFEQALCDRAPPPKLKGGCALRFVRNEAGEREELAINKAYVYAIIAAQKSITIENPYFLPTKDVRDALIDAAKRGVKIKVMTNSAASNDVPLLADISRHYYDELVDAGIEIYEKHGGTLHAKTASFDGEMAIIGSANLNRRSSGADSESILCVNDALMARSLDARFKAGLKECKRVSPRELAKEDWLTNAWQWVASLFARFF